MGGYQAVEKREPACTCTPRKENIISSLLFYWQLKQVPAESWRVWATLWCTKITWKLSNFLPVVNSVCSLCSDPSRCSWEVLRHPGHLEMSDKRKLTAPPNPLLNLSLSLPFFPQYVTKDFRTKMCLMKFQIYILLKWQRLEATVFKATEYWWIKNLPTRRSWPTSEGDLSQFLAITESQNVFQFLRLASAPETPCTFKVMT